MSSSSNSDVISLKRKRGALARLLGGDDSDESDNDDTNNSFSYSSNNNNNNNNSYSYSSNNNNNKDTTIKLNNNDNNNMFLQNVNNVIDSKSLESYVKKKPVGALQLLRGDYDDDDDDDHHDTITSNNNIVNTNSSIKKTVQNIASSNSLIQKKSILELMESKRQEVKESLLNKTNKIKIIDDKKNISNEFNNDRKKKIYNSKDVRPNLDTDAKGPFEPINLNEIESSEEDDDNNNNKLRFYVNKYASRYLLTHQREGVKWLAEKYFEHQGCILGDDMGMGKTIQIACLLMAIYNKTGTYLDKIANRKREGKDLLEPNSMMDIDSDNNNNNNPPAPPCLIVCKASLSKNWFNELERWAYFLINETADKDKESFECAVDEIAKGKKEILIVTYDKMRNEVDLLKEIKWSLIIYDEGHVMKNPNSKTYRAALELKNSPCRMILSGTPLQNKIIELWPLLNIIFNGKFMSQESFKERFVKPIELGNKHHAKEYDVKLSNERLEEFRKKILKKIFLQRKKTILDSLKGKSDLIVMCDLTPIQAVIYKEILELPEYVTLLEDEPENRKKIPNDANNNEEIDPRAAIWRRCHPELKCCQKCMSCCTFPCIMKLLQVSSHPALLQIYSKDKKNDNDNTKNKVETAQDKLYFLNNALKPSTLKLLGGTERNKLSDGSRSDTSGKMQTLSKLLKHFKENGLKVLVFSHSVMMLDIIEDFVKVGCWNYIRLDGDTKTSHRQALCDQFNDPSKGVNLFLLSSRAGGQGLNLTAAYNVVIFDMDWNPAIDSQSQDRAYRIGQTEHVTVYRLVAKGTIEEVVYMKQLYKQEIAKSILDGDTGPKYFDDNINGTKSLFQFSETSIFDKIRGKSNEDDDSNDKSDNDSNSNIETSNTNEKSTKIGFQMVNAANVSDDIENMLNDSDDENDDKNNILSLLGLSKTQMHKHEDVLHGKKQYKQQQLPIIENNNNNNNNKQQQQQQQPIKNTQRSSNDDTEFDWSFTSSPRIQNETIKYDDEPVQPVKKISIYKPSYLK